MLSEKGPWQAAASGPQPGKCQAGGDIGRATSPLFAPFSPLENGLGREGRILLGDLNAPHSSQVA